MNDKKDSSMLRQAVKYSTMGIELILYVVIFLYAGYRLDRWLDLLPLFTLIGSLLGMTLGFYRVYRTIVADEKKNDDSSKGRFK